MMVSLSPTAIVLANIGAWLVIHLLVAWRVTRLRTSRLDPDGWLFCARPFEADGELYDRLFAVRRWKRALPDGAALFKGGFKKKRLMSRDPGYLARFRVETCRGELAHWLPMLFGPLFLVWNPLGAAIVNIVLPILCHAPFIIVQRYNRFRLRGLLERAGLPAAPVMARIEVVS